MPDSPFEAGPHRTARPAEKMTRAKPETRVPSIPPSSIFSRQLFLFQSRSGAGFHRFSSTVGSESRQTNPPRPSQGGAAGVHEHQEEAAKVGRQMLTELAPLGRGRPPLGVRNSSNQPVLERRRFKLVPVSRSCYELQIQVSKQQFPTATAAAPRERSRWNTIEFIFF